jgi:hypothetical protein
VIVVVALGTEIVVSAKVKMVRVKEAVQEIEVRSILLVYSFAKMFVLF